MKKNLLFKALLVISLLCNLNVSGQILSDGFTLGPGFGCDAAQASQGGRIDLPFPQGIKFKDLSLSTKYFTASNYIPFRMRVGIRIDSGSYQGNFIGQLSIDLNRIAIPNTWQETGNLLYGSNSLFEEGGSIMSYDEAVSVYGSMFVWLVAIEKDNSDLLKLDDTRINDLLITYDDCDNDGVVDYYDCDASNSQSQKWYVCHNGNTICVNANGLNAHAAHGDYLGPCQSNRSQSTMMVLNKPEKFTITSSPNPVTSSMKISYELPTDSKISITFFDISGKAITVIADEHRKAGIYSYSFDASKLSSGLYYCKLSATSNNKTFVQGQKVIVIK